MRHLDFTPTPIHLLDYYSKKWNINLWCKRDDLFAKAGGGSKARMLQYILYPLLQNNIEVLITAGGPYSNYNRAAGLMCAELGIKMKLISYTDNIEEYGNSLNHFLTEMSGVEFIYCDKSSVPLTIERVIRDTEQKNEKYVYLYGGGKCLEGIYAYYDAVKELKFQFDSKIDAVFVACGTGTTLTGICAGMQEFFPNALVYGISVARKYYDESAVLDANMHLLNSYLNTRYDFSNLRFCDEYLVGGYGKCSSREQDIIKECISKQGMVIDPTYSGKAFYGMSEILETNFCKSSVLFWNTGGIMNLLSQRNLFDNENRSVTK